MISQSSQVTRASIPGMTPYVLRSAFAGAAGAALLMALAGTVWVFKGVTEWLALILPFGVLVAGVCGAATGVGVGFLVWAAALRRGREPHALLRALTGVGVAVVWTLPASFLDGVPSRRFELAYALAVGLPSGLLAYSKSWRAVAPAAAAVAE